jgi:hypothetical protein
MSALSLPTDQFDEDGSQAARDDRSRRVEPILRSGDSDSSLAEPGPGCLHSEGSVAAARLITFVYGRRTPAVEQYEYLLGYAPVDHVRALRRRGGVVVMTPTIAGWLASDDAAVRRGARLDEREKERDRRQYGADQGIAAIYDPATDALVLPTGHRARDLLHPVLHELGHAMTLGELWLTFSRYEPLLRALPPRLADHLARYPQEDTPDARRMRVLELFAEAYAMMIGGWHAELSAELSSAVFGIVRTVSEADAARPSERIDPETGRTTTYCRPSDMVQEDGIGTNPSGDKLPALTQGDARLLRRRAREWPPVDRVRTN